MMRRGSSLQSRRSKTSGDPSKGSPQAQRRGTQDGLLHPVRPRSSSTDAHCSPAQAEGQLANSHVPGDDYDRERYEGSGPAVSPSLAGSDGSAETGESSVDPQRTRQVVTQLQQKILKLTEQIKIEQTARDDNVAEYLKLAHGAADKQQGARIKQVFEKKNQKSAQSIQQLQKKLEHCHRKLREAEHNGIARQPKDVLRDVQQGLKDVGARVTHSVAAKPREIASLLRNRFGSADNIPGLEEGPGEEGPAVQPPPSPRYDSEDECSSATSGSAGANSTAAAAAAAAGPSAPGFGLETLLQELQDVRNGQSRLMEYLDELKTYYQRDYSFILQALQEERYRCERLEEQLNDLTELHQNEIFLLKQELASMEEKVAYQSYERGQDIQEALEACQTRISKMELQQQQQQVVQLEGLENATARTLLGKLINVLLAAMAVLLVFVSTLSSCVGPLMRTRTRSISTLLLLLLLAGLWKTWDAMGQLWDHVWHYSR